MAEWPTTPEPPVRFTTLIGWPSSFSRSEATIRAVASVPPPAPQGTIRVSGRSGKAACARLANPIAPAQEHGSRRGGESPSFHEFPPWKMKICGIALPLPASQSRCRRHLTLLRSTTHQRREIKACRTVPKRYRSVNVRIHQDARAIVFVEGTPSPYRFRSHLSRRIREAVEASFGRHCVSRALHLSANA